MYFLRLTATPKEDLIRKTSIDLCGYSRDEKEYAVEAITYSYGEDQNIVFFENFHSWGRVLAGCCGYALDSETVEEAKVEALDYIDSDSDANSTSFGKRQPYIFIGEYSEDEIDDGFVFIPTGNYWKVKK